jgi:hypothetical protein
MGLEASHAWRAMLNSELVGPASRLTCYGGIPGTDLNAVTVRVRRLTG